MKKTAIIIMPTTPHTLSITLDQLPQAAQQLLNSAHGNRIWLLEGEMGAGKTTLTKALCAALGVTDTVTSPTFAIVQEYSTQAGEPVYHFDCYRLAHEEEATDLDCTNYFESGHHCFVEWSSKIKNLIPPRHCKVSILPQPDGSRQLTWQLYGEK